MIRIAYLTYLQLTERKQKTKAKKRTKKQISDLFAKIFVVLI